MKYVAVVRHNLAHNLGEPRDQAATSYAHVDLPRRRTTHGCISPCFRISTPMARGGVAIDRQPLVWLPPKHVTTDAVSELEMETLKTAFHSSAEGGVLGRAQLAAVLRDVGFGPVPSDRLFDLFDVDGNGEVRSLPREEFGRGTGRGYSVILYSPKTTC